jgi:hypothetical protein
MVGSSLSQLLSNNIIIFTNLLSIPNITVAITSVSAVLTVVVPIILVAVSTWSLCHCFICQHCSLQI